MPGRILLAGGGEEDEEDVAEIELRAQEEDEAGTEDSEEGDGPGPPL